MILEGIIWLISWLAIWSIYLYIFPKIKKNNVLATAYFLLIPLPILYFFRNYLLTIIKGNIFLYILIVIMTVIFTYFSYFLIRNNLKKPTNSIKKHPNIPSISAKYSTIIPGTMEIIFQQLMIIILIAILIGGGLSLVKIMFLFALLFALLHINYIWDYNLKLGIVYIISSFVAGLLFPYFILNFSRGFVITFLIHSLYKIFFTTFFWIKGK